MLLRTHIALGLLAALLFLPHVEHKLLFLAICLVASILPDVDTPFSAIGKPKLMRFFQLFVRHRGMIHSLTIATAVSILLAFVWPLAALPFFLGYSVHLLADAFTRDGIIPFWPLRKKTSWIIRTDSMEETALFVLLIALDVLVIVLLLQH